VNSCFRQFEKATSIETEDDPGSPESGVREALKVNRNRWFAESNTFGGRRLVKPGGDLGAAKISLVS
jgi:hypothetical protein